MKRKLLTGLLVSGMMLAAPAVFGDEPKRPEKPRVRSSTVQRVQPKPPAKPSSQPLTRRPTRREVVPPRVNNPTNPTIRRPRVDVYHHRIYSPYGWGYWDWRNNFWFDLQYYRHRYNHRESKHLKFDIKQPAGYDDADAIYIAKPGERSIAVELVKNLPGRVEMTVLRDDDADGDLEFVVRSEGRTRKIAKRNVPLVLEGDQFDKFNRMYENTLYHQVRAELDIKRAW